ncbi:MAG: hypothetical protein SGI84_09890 [Gemmatimonadota bacterium]|nr:hypothetical protein [Gemmatimonadota bacterium]
MADHATRLSPFELALGPFAPDRLGEVHRALAAAEVDPFDRDAWAISQAGAALLHELRPESGLGEAVAELVALAHAGFLFWQQGQQVRSLSRPSLDALVSGAPAATPSRSPSAYYLQLPPRRVWGTPVEGEPPEPLDGWFAQAQRDHLALVAVFGLLPGRPGFTVAHTDGPVPGPLAREDGSPLFASTLEGGTAAGLWSLVGQRELLELGWRAHHLILAGHE